MTSNSLLRGTLEYTKHSADVLSSNFLAKDDSSVTVKKVRAQPQIIAGKYGNIKSQVVRNVDLFRLQQIRSSGANVDYNGVIKDSLKYIQDSIGSVNPGEMPRLLEPVTKFFRDMVSITGSAGDQGLKDACVKDVAAICKNLNDTAELAYKQKQQAQNKIAEELERLNSSIRELVGVNSKISQEFGLGNDVSCYLDRRDALITEISSVIMVEQPRYRPDGSVLLSSSGQLLVDRENYCSFEFTPCDLIDIENGKALPDINVKHMRCQSTDSLGRVVGSFVTRNSFYNNSQRNNLAEGRLKGLIDLHEIYIQEYIGSVDNLSFNLSEHLNRVHNSGSPYPGRNQIKGLEAINSTARQKWTGSTTIGVVDSNGLACRTEGGAGYKVAPMKLDLENLCLVSKDGMLSGQDIIDEINAHFAGNIEDAVGMGNQNGTDNQYLLHNVNMVVSYSDDEELRFDFEGLNTSDFGAKIKILGVSNVNGANVRGALPEDAKILSGQKLRTFQTTVLNKNHLVGPQDIEVEIRVIGDNGEVFFGKVKFTVDFNAQIKAGTRISAQVVSGDFEVLNLNRDTLLRATLEDEKGLPATQDENGYMVFESTSPDNRIIMQDDDSKTSLWADGFGAIMRGFGHFYGLNNLLETAQKNGRYALDMTLRSDIDSDPLLFSNTRLVQEAPETKSLNIGVAKASANIDYSGGINDGETITIAGKVFTFGDAPGQINIVAGNIAATIDNLITSINNTRYFDGFLDFSKQGTNFIITAVNPGESGNKILYNIGLGNRNLEGGLNEDRTIDVVNIPMQVASAYQDLFADIVQINSNVKFLTSKYVNFAFGSISSLATMACNNMTGVFDSIERQFEVSKGVLQLSASDYKRDFGYDQDSIATDIEELAQFKMAVVSATAKLMHLQMQIIEIMTR